MSALNTCKLAFIHAPRTTSAPSPSTRSLNLPLTDLIIKKGRGGAKDGHGWTGVSSLGLVLAIKRPKPTALQLESHEPG